MAIKMPHKSEKPTTADAKADAFISGASLKAETPTPTPTPKKPMTAKKTMVNMRIDPVLLDCIDVSAKKRGISRTAWISMVVSRALESGEG